LASAFLVFFLLVFSEFINFDGLTQLEKLFYLGLEICISIIIYFGISKAINGNGLKGMMN
jgi:hypothetical protein